MSDILRVEGLNKYFRKKHAVRDVTFGEDACRVARPKAARNRVTLCNLAIGLFNLERKRGRTKAPSLPSWQRSMTPSAALRRVMN